MYITVNSSPDFSNNVINCQNHRECRPPAFTGVSGAYDSFCNCVGKNVCRPIFNNKAIDKLGYLMRNSENSIKHFLAVGSAITSGMYIKQTLTNKQMDKDRKKTLATNQFFTFALSTAMAYTLDAKIKSWWKNKHEQYVHLTPEGTAVWDGMTKANKEIAEKNKSVTKELQQPKWAFDDYLDKFGKKHVMDKDALEKLKSRSKGFGALRSILVFGFIYRFFVPIAVVKPTNWLCNWYLDNKKKKEAGNPQTVQGNRPLKTTA